ncbi:MAG: DUF4271 domain-containing protein [Bacteroidaceae bacterium]|nr:DUF4271 domain-containing protein [Bacteroidaceae bacterium]
MDTLFYKGFFERDSLLQNDSLLFHPPGICREDQIGMPVELRPHLPYDNDSLTLLLLLCFLLLVVVIVLRRRTVSEQISNFLYPQVSQSSSGSHSDKLNNSFFGGWLTDYLLIIMACLLYGTLYFLYAKEHWTLWTVPLTTLHWLGIYSGVCLVFFALKQLLIVTINHIFFPREKRRLWVQAYGFLFNSESILLLPLLLATIYLRLSPEIVIYSFLFLLLFVKTWVLIKDFTYFFGKFYGILHLFVYFCTLEAVPILVLWTVLGCLTNYLTTTL